MVRRLFVLTLLLFLLLSGCTNGTELSENKVAACRQVIEDYFEDRSVDLSEGYEHRYLDKKILKKYCHENVCGEGSKQYYVFIAKDYPKFISYEYDRKSSEDENDYLVKTIGKCRKFNFRFQVLCCGKVTLNQVEYYKEPKIFDTEFLMLFEHGKPKIAELGFIQFVYEKDLPCLLENLELQP